MESIKIENLLQGLIIIHARYKDADICTDWEEIYISDEENLLTESDRSKLKELGWSFFEAYDGVFLFPTKS